MDTDSGTFWLALMALLAALSFALVVQGTSYYKHENEVFLKCVEDTGRPLECKEGIR